MTIHGYTPAHSRDAQVLLILGSLGLTGLNVAWLAKILAGVWRAFARGRGPPAKPDPAAAAAAAAAAAGEAAAAAGEGGEAKGGG